MTTMARPPATAEEIAALEDMARRIRVAVIRTVKTVKVGHVGGPLSSADILAALYGRLLRIRPSEPHWPDRDRFILSKGHSALGQYAAMALAGYFPLEEMFTFDQKGSRLQGHPDMNKLPGIDISTGSLGMGLSAGLGFALGARHLGRDVRTWVLLGDGECQEGQVWEAAHVAPRFAGGQPHRHHRPQQVPAVRLARARRQSTACLRRTPVTWRPASPPSAGGSWRWTATTCRRSWPRWKPPPSQRVGRWPSSPTP